MSITGSLKICPNCGLHGYIITSQNVTSFAIVSKKEAHYWARRFFEDGLISEKSSISLSFEIEHCSLPNTDREVSSTTLLVAASFNRSLRQIKLADYDNQPPSDLEEGFSTECGKWKM